MSFAITALWSGLSILWTLSNQMVMYHRVVFKIESVQSIAPLNFWKKLFFDNNQHLPWRWNVKSHGYLVGVNRTLNKRQQNVGNEA